MSAVDNDHVLREPGGSRAPRTRAARRAMPPCARRWRAAVVQAAGWILAAAVVTAAASAPPAPGTAAAQVWAAEQAFARTMADRDLSAFAEHVSDEAVFFTGTTALHGRREVVRAWAAYFSGPDAPFSWAPDQVEVLASGTLALSTGPVRDPSGRVIARFNSVWRLEAPGRWRVVFDKGSPPSPGPP